jgi:hypothetical protein
MNEEDVEGLFDGFCFSTYRRREGRERRRKKRREICS